jgi:Ca-activated chloride channel family protein
MKASDQRYIPQTFDFTDEAGAIRLSVSLFNRFALAGSRGENFVLFEIASLQPKSSARESTINMSLLLDKSHSMFGGPFREVIQAARVIIDQLEDRDYLSIIAFDQDVDLIQSSKRKTVPSKLKRDLEAIEVAGGSTDIGKALETGFAEVQKHMSSETIDKVVLLTDGRPNRGLTRDDEFYPLAERIRAGGVSLSAVGMGPEYNEELLAALARLTGGGFYHSSRPREVKAIFRKEIARSLNVSHRGLSLKITPKRWVKLKEVVGFPAKFDEGSHYIELPDLERSDKVGIIVNISFEEHPPGLFRILDCELSYRPAGRGMRGQVKGSANLKFHDDPILLKEGKNPRVDKALLMLNVRSDLISTLKGIKTQTISAAQAEAELKEYQRTLVLSGQTDAAKEIEKAIETLRANEPEDAGKILSQSAFDMEKGFSSENFIDEHSEEEGEDK